MPSVAAKASIAEVTDAAVTSSPKRAAAAEAEPSTAAGARPHGLLETTVVMEPAGLLRRCGSNGRDRTGGDAMSAAVSRRVRFAVAAATAARRFAALASLSASCRAEGSERGLFFPMLPPLPTDDLTASTPAAPAPPPLVPAFADAASSAAAVARACAAGAAGAAATAATAAACTAVFSPTESGAPRSFFPPAD